MAAVSIFGWFPQSAQYMVLKGNAELHDEQRQEASSAEPRLSSALLLVVVLPSLWIHHDGVRLVYHARDQGLAVLAGYLGHLDDIPARVGPVQVPSHPVHGDSSRHLQLFDLDKERR